MSTRFETAPVHLSTLCVQIIFMASLAVTPETTRFWWVNRVESKLLHSSEWQHDRGLENTLGDALATPKVEQEGEKQMKEMGEGDDAVLVFSKR